MTGFTDAALLAGGAAGRDRARRRACSPSPCWPSSAGPDPGRVRRDPLVTGAVAPSWRATGTGTPRTRSASWRVRGGAPRSGSGQGRPRPRPGPVGGPPGAAGRRPSTLNPFDTGRRRFLLSSACGTPCACAPSELTSRGAARRPPSAPVLLRAPLVPRPCRPVRRPAGSAFLSRRFPMSRPLPDARRGRPRRAPRRRRAFDRLVAAVLASPTAPLGPLLRAQLPGTTGVRWLRQEGLSPTSRPARNCSERALRLSLLPLLVLSPTGTRAPAVRRAEEAGGRPAGPGSRAGRDGPCPAGGSDRHQSPDRVLGGQFAGAVGEGRTPRPAPGDGPRRRARQASARPRAAGEPSTWSTSSSAGHHVTDRPSTVGLPVHGQLP